VMLNSVIEDLIRLTAQQPAVSATHDFVLRRATLALCRMTLNPQACEHMVWSEGGRTLGAAVLTIGSKPVLPDGTIVNAINLASAAAAAAAAAGGSGAGGGGGGSDVAALVNTGGGSGVEHAVEIKDAILADLGAAVGVLPHPVPGVPAQLQSRYPTAHLHRKCAAALCRLSWGEPPSNSFVAAPSASSSAAAAKEKDKGGDAAANGKEGAGGDKGVGAPTAVSAAGTGPPRWQARTQKAAAAAASPRSSPAPCSAPPAAAALACLCRSTPRWSLTGIASAASAWRLWRSKSMCAPHCAACCSRPTR
jgi:hypothetical protein